MFVVDGLPFGWSEAAAGFDSQPGRRGKASHPNEVLPLSAVGFGGRPVKSKRGEVRGLVAEHFVQNRGWFAAQTGSNSNQRTRWIAAPERPGHACTELDSRFFAQLGNPPKFEQLAEALPEL